MRRIIGALLLPWTITASSLYQDLLARPYYDLQFANTSITKAEADTRRSISRDDIKYRLLHDGRDRYLCEIPNVNVLEDRQTPEERLLANKFEKEESLRASERGWQLLQGLEGTCLYWISGWWTYKLCYSEGITQFHALTPAPGAPLWPPREDEAAGIYSLGKRPKSISAQGKDATSGNDEISFRLSGDTKSLVINYDKGSYCPLIGAERKTEVQFLCHPGTNDHIAMVKEVSSCRYLFTVHTARLCHDVAFREAEKEPSNGITCTRIGEHAVPALEASSEQIKPSEETSTPAPEAQSVTDEATLSLEDGVENSVDRELTELSHEAVLEPVGIEYTTKNQVSTRGGSRPPTGAETADESALTDQNPKLTTAIEMANDIADQLEDGTLTVEGRSIFDPKNRDVEYEVQLQDEDGEELGSVVMKVIDGQLSIELADELAEAQALEDEKAEARENRLAAESVPDHVRAQFDRFVAGHDEL